MSEAGQNGKDAAATILKAEEATVTAVIQSKLAAQDILRENDRQLVAYRIAEIMVGAKELYTKELPRIASEGEPEDDLFTELAGLRMSFLHLRDLITDFDEAFMIAMAHQREDDEEEEEESLEDSSPENNEAE